MTLRPNETQEAQELYDMFNASCYDGDGDAYEDWPEDDSFSSEELDDASFSRTAKTQRSIRRRKTARAKCRFFGTISVVAKNLRARNIEADSNPHSFDKAGIIAADRLIKAAKKMGMDI